MNTSLPLLVLLAAAAVPAAEPAAPIRILDHEVVVLYGDSITEQNLYAAFIESFLVTRFPGKSLSIHNYGWSGDTASGGQARFARDVAPVKPTLVFVNYGMNDGRYQPPDEGIRAGYLAAQRRLAATITASGARQVLLTTSPVDPDKARDRGVYNETLALMADGVLALGAEFGVPTADIFHPMLDEQRAAKAADPGFSMIPDGIHPNAVGHLVMAYHVLQRIEAPKGIGRIAVRGSEIEATGGATTANGSASPQGVAFDLSLSCLPCPVPPAARAGLALVPFQRDLNRLELSVAGLEANASWSLTVDGREVATLSSEQLEAGADLATIDGAPWTAAAQRVWDIGQRRWSRHYDTWRGLGMEANPVVAGLPAHAAMVAASTAYIEALGDAMRDQASTRGPWKIALSRSNLVPLDTIELAPVLAATEPFEHRYAPEADPAGTAWKPMPFTGALDFSQVLGARDQCVVHARLVLQAERECTIVLGVGSDDGLIVTVNGERVLTRNVTRGLRPREDSVEAALVRGRNELIFRVSQGGGGYGLAVEAKVVGNALVTLAKP
jgi:lysophospholipase L1-like esterase